MGGKTNRNARLRLLAVVLAGAGSAWALLLPAAAAADPQPFMSTAYPLPGPIAAPAQPAPQGLGILRATPDIGVVGTGFTLTGESLPPSRDVEVVWSTGKGSYLMNPLADTVEYLGRQLDPLDVVLAKARTDAQGKLRVDLKVPEDYGSLHDIYVVSDGVQLAKGGYLVNRNYEITPKKGPIGAPVTIKVTGLGWKPYESTATVMWDNRYAGFLSATSTRGTAIAQIRAAGPVGRHTLEIIPASHAVPYLDIEQSAVFFVGKYGTTFRVTKDAGPSPAVLDWPEPVEPVVAQQTTLTLGNAAGVSASLSSESGPILSKVDVKASGLAADAPVDIQWVTAVGTRARASGWSLATLPLGQANAEPDGSLGASFKVPDNLGGWHAVQLLQGGKVKAEVPYYVERSFVSVTPQKVKAGERFQINLKGIGWTELDNGYAITYDNGYIGYACGFYSKGDITMNLVASGEPGTHLIDLYPMLYKGKSYTDLWSPQAPMLTFKRDFPGLALGYRLPAIRLAIEVVE